MREVFIRCEMECWIEKGLSKERKEHIERTTQIAKSIAKAHNLDQEKVETASILHDCAKDLSEKDAKRLIDRYNIELDKIEKKEKGLWHGVLGAEIAKREFGIDDEEILEAIRIHSTGDSNMSLLAKVLYIADYLESWPDEEIKKTAKRDLDSALRMVVIRKMEYIFKKGSLLHLRSVNLYNSVTDVS
jgi:predicted HD superfamily hydrolase involved in NAD metabolism